MIIHYELRDDPDDLPIICGSEVAARRRGRRRAERTGGAVLLYEVDDLTGERLIGGIEAN